MANFKKMRTALNKVGKSGFLIGVGSILNIFPVYNNRSNGNLLNPDAQVLKSDWKAIGGDFDSAIKKLNK